MFAFKRINILSNTTNSSERSRNSDDYARGGREGRGFVLMRDSRIGHAWLALSRFVPGTQSCVRTCTENTQPTCVCTLYER